ncbi:YggS family pyridoxal phosphate-dependent enzyme [Gordonia sp. ABSL1-1]|uniref:YggS family pyridoxal phosphate-dependent enzyme n=1 Tax=Gordonia sp. ABSL1-1 TaxID=3053923 RepID=UPI002572272B|nr:YggS family pyridoxal phosphate-dependent enzyme [Gordonia sp. ABSL1-1]MDL9937411.1 YggS family pyridoxal phosphate-dependent enzyme [Gordonia sp. ABSL1-1]
MTSPADDARTAELAERLGAVRARLAAAVAAAGRPAAAVELLVVTKYFPAQDVRRLIALGERAFGESREPEASRKVAEIRAEVTGVAFDMIGSVQTKKAKVVARWARSVHSVDRDKLVVALEAAAAAALDAGDRADPLGVYLQVSLDGDPARGGVVAADLSALADLVVEAPALELRGLMAIAPLDGPRERWMAELADVHERFQETYPQAVGLSAGMSGDMEPAVHYGSTCVRVGTAILGDRPLLSQ